MPAARAWSVALGRSLFVAMMMDYPGLGIVPGRRLESASTSDAVAAGLVRGPTSAAGKAE
jgi:hypothetical protein